MVLVQSLSVSASSLKPQLFLVFSLVNNNKLIYCFSLTGCNISYLSHLVLKILQICRNRQRTEDDMELQLERGLRPEDVSLIETVDTELQLERGLRPKDMSLLEIVHREGLG